MKREEFELQEFYERREPMTRMDRWLLLGMFVGSWGLFIALGMGIFNLLDRVMS